MKELSIINTQELANKDLVKNIKGIQTEIIKKDKSNFKIARHISNIINNDLWKDDFETQKDIANYLGVSASQISMFITVDYYKKIIEKMLKENNIAGIEFDKLSLSKLAELKPLRKMVSDDLSIEEVFMNFNSLLLSIGLKASELTQIELREKVKAFIGEDTKETEEDTEDTEDTEETEETQEEPKATTKDAKENDVTISIGKDVYEIENVSPEFLKDLTKLLKKYDLI